MKRITQKTLILLTALAFMSCGQSKEEKLIADHVQTLGKAKMDLNFKLKKLDKLEDITAADSLKHYTDYFEEKKKGKIEEFQSSLDNSQADLEKYTKELAETNPNHENLIKSYNRYIERAKETIERQKTNIELYETDCKGTFLEPVLAAMKAYESQGNKVLLTKYKTSYSIDNPLMNNAKAEYNEEYYINPEATKIYLADAK